MEWAGCTSRAYDIEQIGLRVERCLCQVRDALSALHQIQLLQWQSPAGHAYRAAVYERSLELQRALGGLENARTAISLHALAASVSQVQVPFSLWPGDS